MHGVEEVHPDHALGARGRLGDLRDRQRRRVGREERARRGDRVEPREDLALELERLGNGLDRQIDPGRGELEFGGRSDPIERRRLLLGGDLAPGDALVERHADPVDSPLDEVHGRVVQPHLEARGRRDLGDPTTHRPRAEDRDRLHMAHFGAAG